MPNVFENMNAKQFVTSNWELTHGHGSKLLLVLPSLRGLHSIEEAEFCETMVT